MSEEKKYRVSGWVTEETYNFMNRVKEDYRNEKGLKLSQGMLVDLAFKELEKNYEDSK